MEINKTAINGVFIIEPKVFHDARGYFFESFSRRDFDAFAHIDYICRYWPYEGEERELRLADAPNLFDKLFQLLIDKNIPIEINTRRLDDTAAVAGLLPLYERYHALGGKYCTIGSDAHYAEHVGRRLQEALKIATACQLTPVYFRKRRMQIMEVSK